LLVESLGKSFNRRRRFQTQLGDESVHEQAFNGQDARWPHSQDGCATVELFALARSRAGCRPWSIGTTWVRRGTGGIVGDGLHKEKENGGAWKRLRVVG